MHISQHADQRMNQRGISRRLVEFALRHGRVEGNKHVLDRNESRRLIAALNEELRPASRSFRVVLKAVEFAAHKHRDQPMGRNGGCWPGRASVDCLYGRELV